MINPFAFTARNNIWKMYAVRFLFWTHFVASVLIPFLRDWGGMDFTRILLLNAWFMAWNFLLEVPTGSVADLFGRRVSVALAIVVFAAGLWTYVSWPSFAFFLVAEALFACAMTLLSGADEALVYDSLKEVFDGDDRALAEAAKRVIPRLESFKLGGIVLGAMCGSLIASRFDLTMPLKAQSVPLGLAFLLCLTLYEPQQRRASEVDSEPYLRILLGGVRYFLGHRILRTLTLDMVFHAAFAFMIIWFYQPFLESAGVQLQYFGLVHTGMALGQILFLAQAGRITALLGSDRRLLAVVPLVVGGAYIGLGITHQVPAVVILILLASTFGLSRPVLFGAFLNRHIPSAKRATVLSTVSMARTMTIGLVYPIVGLLADASLSLAIIVLGSAMILLTFASRIRDEHLDGSLV